MTLPRTPICTEEITAIHHRITNSHQVILVINAKSVTEVPEDLGTILLELEMTGQIFPAMQVFKVRQHSNNVLHVDIGIDDVQTTFILMTHFNLIKPGELL